MFRKLAFMSKASHETPFKSEKLFQADRSKKVQMEKFGVEAGAVTRFRPLGNVAEIASLAWNIYGSICFRIYSSVVEAQ